MWRFYKNSYNFFRSANALIEMQRAQEEAFKADLFIVVGSSLVVYPAASLPLIAKENGAKFVIINNEETDFDNLADLVINDDISKVFKEALN